MTSATPFAAAFVERHPFGHLAAVHLPAGLDPVPVEVLARLVPEEAAHAAGLRARRQIEWTGGRLALRLAAAAAGVALPAVLPGPRGEPLLPAGVQASVSHKRSIALALVAHGAATVGLDVEELEPPRPSIARRILTEAEGAEVAALPEAAQWPAILARFAIKEAIYKAVHPHVQRYVAFSEATVALDPPAATLALAHGEGAYLPEVELQRRGDLLLAAVRIAP
ncbi:4'-phosphopantetheinyl transferase superfamily protein [Vulgatibacter sp.]|uniref:4'-phosphopantetheinyl transferase superfamily protein n=1 Tax=Vulgatibacter sp. TaxID=1971226 RepID=UPI003569E90B